MLKRILNRLLILYQPQIVAILSIEDDKEFNGTYTKELEIELIPTAHKIISNFETNRKMAGGKNVWFVQILCT
jgi:hypothetical protein